MKASIGYRCLGPLLTALLVVPCGWLTACETVAKVDRDKLDTHASMSGGTASTSANTGSVGLGGTTNAGSSSETESPAPSGGTDTAAGGFTSASSGSGGTGLTPGEAGVLGSAGGSDAAAGGATSNGVVEVTKSRIAYDPVPAVSAGDEDALVSDLNDFGLRVLVRLASSDRNFVASPVSGFVALAMTSAGALGATAAEMRSVLYPDVSETEAHATVNQLQQQIRGYARAVVQTDDGEKKVEVNLVNDLFAQKGMTIEPPFLDTLAVNYGSGVELVDFEKDADGATLLIDDWVAKETNDRIKDLIPLGALDALTRAVVVNALYLHANWKTAFNPAATHTGTFHGATGDGSADFMHAERDFNYATGPGWVGVDIPYYGDSLVFTAVLPDAGQFETVKTSLNAAWFSKFDQAAKSQYIYITLPKFKIARMSAIWTQALVDLGMTSLFNSACNLRGIVAEGPSIHVKDVLQQVFVDVTESGTEAAAATSVTFTIDIAPTANVVLDRPFLFFVRQRSGPILFAGQILDLPVL